MSKAITMLMVCYLGGIAEAEELRVSSREPVVVEAPDRWKSEKDKALSDKDLFETYRVAPAGDRNVVLLVTVLPSENRELGEAEPLKKLLKEGCRQYLSSPDEKFEIKELKIEGGRGYYANFVDPDLVGKPVIRGKYKTATPMNIILNSKYVISVTLLCDDLKGDDYRDAFKVAESIRVKKE